MITNTYTVPVSIIDTMEEETIMVCLFCDCEVDIDSIVCPMCREYKGIMTVEAWQDYTGEIWE